MQNGVPKTVLPSVSKEAKITQVKNIQDNPMPTAVSVTKQTISTAQPKPAKSQTDATVVKTEKGNFQVLAIILMASFTGYN